MKFVFEINIKSYSRNYSSIIVAELKEFPLRNSYLFENSLKLTYVLNDNVVAYSAFQYDYKLFLFN